MQIIKQYVDKKEAFLAPHFVPRIRPQTALAGSKSRFDPKRFGTQRGASAETGQGYFFQMSAIGYTTNSSITTLPLMAIAGPSSVWSEAMLYAASPAFQKLSTMPRSIRKRASTVWPG